LCVIAAGWYLAQSRYRAATRRRRRQAWHAQREEEDRIWYETMGERPDEEGRPLRRDHAGIAGES
jgi:hypothetical protein